MKRLKPVLRLTLGGLSRFRQVKSFSCIYCHFKTKLISWHMRWVQTKPFLYQLHSLFMKREPSFSHKEELCDSFEEVLLLKFQEESSCGLLPEWLSVFVFVGAKFHSHKTPLSTSRIKHYLTGTRTINTLIWAQVRHLRATLRKQYDRISRRLLSYQSFLVAQRAYA